MSAAADKILRRSTFFYRCRGIDLVGATPYMVDSGPHGLHAAMANFVAPAYGLVSMPDGRPGIQFNGTTQYASLPLRFYDHAPTQEATLVLYGAHTHIANTATPFSCDNNSAGGTWKGLLYQTIADARLLLRRGQGGAALPTVDCTAATPVPALRVMVASLASTARCHSNRAPCVTAWTTGAFGTTVFDPAIVPTIGARPILANYWQGPILTLGLFPWAFTASEAQYMTDLIQSGAV